MKNLIIFSLIILMAACATTKKSAVDQENQDIVITEEHGIDDDIKDKFTKAVEFMNDEEYEDAVVILEEVTHHTKKHSAPYVNLGIAYSALGNIEKAENNLLKALEINPDHPVTNNELGMIYRRKGQFEQARIAYEKVIKTYPLFLPARKNLGILCDLFMKDLICAIEQYEAYLKLVPEDKNVNIWLVDLKRRAGQSK